ncbi:MAG: nitroreductase [Marinobacter sp.]|nr:nitroreductase [Marinobacter sp.]
MNSVINAILDRKSQPRLCGPAPAPEVLEVALACALRAPDHALQRPWRYLVIEGEGLQVLGEVFAAAAADPVQPIAGDPERMRQLPLRAPMILVPITCHRHHPKVPPLEEQMSTAAGVAYLLLALESQGYGAMWRTGELAAHPAVANALGLADNEQVAGFVYVGTVLAEKPKVTRPAVADVVRRWPSEAR